jgi:multimeric flavodoxin WrbA
MKVLIMNGDDGTGAHGLDPWLSRFGVRLLGKGHTIQELRLRDLGIKRCLGCWNCWWPSPGVCIHKDGMSDVLKEIIAADLVFWGIPLVLGAQSSLAKHCQDRMIPLVHPYITLVKGECHHRARYAHYPRHALALASGSGDTAEDLDLAALLFSRFALNLKSGVDYWTSTATGPEEAADAAIGA